MSAAKVNKEAEEYCKKHPSAEADELIRHLTDKFPGVLVPTINGIVSSYIPTPYPTSPAVIKPTKTPPVPWYAYQPSKHVNFKHFITTTLPKTMKLNTSAINTISSSTKDLTNLIPDPTLPKFDPCYGLVIGNVQSGKTANFTGLIARTADSGYNLIVVLSGGNFNDLRVQTQKRLFKDLIDPVNILSPKKKWHKATGWDDENKGDVEDEVWDPNWDIAKENCLIVSKKNASTLEKLRKWIDTHITGTSYPVNLLLIDDEADHASLNLLAKKKTNPSDDATRINKEIRLLLNSFQRHVYIGFTASPFANMFVPPQTDGTKHPKTGKVLPTLYPRDFIYLLPEPEGYFGLKKMCPGDHASFTPRHLSEVGEKEAEFYHKNSTVRKLKDAIKPGLRDAIFDSFIALGMRYHREGKNRNFHHSMLIHTIVTKKEMHGILDTVRPFVSLLKGIIASGGTTRPRKEIFSAFEKRYTVRKKTIDSPLKFSDLRACITEYFSDLSTHQFPEVLEVSSDPEKGSDLRYPDSEPYFVIAIGALRLSRGFTLEQLLTSYFVREPKQVKSDTLIQQGRWFGFRGGNEDLVTIHLTESLRDHFWALKEVENELHDAVHHFQNSQLDPKYFAVPVMKAANQLPTEMAKIPAKRAIVHSLLESDYIPKKSTGFPISNTSALKTAHIARNKDTMEQFDALVSKAVAASGGSLPTRDNTSGNYVFQSVPLDDVVEFLKNSLSNFVDDVFNKKMLLEYLDTRKANGNECSLWTVAVIGNKPNKKTDQPVVFKSGSPHKFTLSLVERSRTDVNSDNLGTFTQSEDFEIGMTVPPSTAKTRRRLCGLRDPTNPLLLVYLVDKNSKPRVGRHPLKTNDHIFTMAIAFPPALLTAAEKKKYNSEVWWNQKLQLDK